MSWDPLFLVRVLAPAAAAMALASWLQIFSVLCMYITFSKIILRIACSLTIE